MTIVVSLSATNIFGSAESSPTRMPTTISIRIAQIARRMLRGACSLRMSLTLRLLLERLAEVPAEHAVPVVHELHEDRLVEAVALPDALDDARVDGAGCRRRRAASAGSPGSEEEQEEQERQRRRSTVGMSSRTADG